MVTTGRDSLTRGSYVSVKLRRRCSSVAEQLIRNQQVVGSSPTAGSTSNRTLPRRLPRRRAVLVPRLVPDLRLACPTPPPRDKVEIFQGLRRRRLGKSRPRLPS